MTSKDTKRRGIGCVGGGSLEGKAGRVWFKWRVVEESEFGMTRVRGGQELITDGSGGALGDGNGGPRGVVIQGAAQRARMKSA